ncbi:MAG: hypothetical protein ABTD50_12075 [Polyangiaceae bacterium]
MTQRNSCREWTHVWAPQTCNTAGTAFSVCACIGGSSDAGDDGSTDGSSDGSSDGSRDGSSDGSSDGANDGSGDGANALPTCVPNAQQSCVCAAGGAGVQTCDAAGTRFSVCSCVVGAGEGGVEGGSTEPAEAGSEGGSDGSPDASGCEVSGTFLMDQPCGGTPNVAMIQVTLSATEVVGLRTPVSNAMDTCTYVGTMSPDCGTVFGTFSCTGAGGGSGTWSATVFGKCANGSVCGLGTSWTEDEAYTGTAGCTATWTQQ